LQGPGWGSAPKLLGPVTKGLSQGRFMLFEQTFIDESATTENGRSLPSAHRLTLTGPFRG